MEDKSNDRMVTMLKAMGNTHRFKIITFLASHPGCITGDIVEKLPLAQSTTSQHLKVLKDAGWIQGTIEGTATNYCLHRENSRWFMEAMQNYFKEIENDWKSNS